MSNRKATLFVSIALFSFYLIAQEPKHGVISGKAVVRNSLNGAGAVVVELYSGSNRLDKCITEVNGEFRFEARPLGVYELKYSKVAHRIITPRQQVIVSGANAKVAQVHVFPKEQTLTVTVVEDALRRRAATTGLTETSTGDLRILVADAVIDTEFKRQLTESLAKNPPEPIDIRPSGFPDITIADLKRAIAEKKVVVIDVRGAPHYKAVRIPGAIDYNSMKHEFATNTFLRELDLVAYSNGPYDMAAIQVAGELRGLGFAHAKVFSAGIGGWVASGEWTTNGTPAVSNPILPQKK